ncbi:MAG: acylphosphatase [Candidatus Kerfeldbacteria bacterium]|nr:acylphosphatase [Candidatus Kerfeldbacteria bacterium]
MRTVQLTLSGLVQGVTMRLTVQIYARQHGIVGWVKNMRNGTVAIMAQASAAEITQFIEWLRYEIPVGRDISVQVSETVAPQTFDGFKIL